MAVDAESTSVLKDILEELSAFPGVIGGVIAASTGAVVQSFQSLSAAMDRTTAAVTRLNTLFERMFAAAMSRQSPDGMRALPAHGNMKAEPVGPAGGGAAGGAAESSGLGALAKAGAIAAAALGALAIVVHLVESQFRKMEGYVRLFNPGVVTMFQQAIDNLGATIGRAFVPVIQNATEVVRQWAGVLAPIVSQLAPTIKAIADVLANTLARALTQLGAVIRASLPVIRILADVLGMVAEMAAALFGWFSQMLRAVIPFVRIFYELSGLGLIVRLVTMALERFNVVMRILDEALSIVEVVVSSLVDSLLAWVRGLLPFFNVMGGLNKAVENVIRNMYVWAVMLAKFAGAMGVVDALIGYVESKLKTGDVAAQTPQIKSLEQLSKDLALAAAAAGGAAGQGGVKNQQEFWQKTLEEMRAAKANGMSIHGLVEAILAELKKLSPGAAAGVAAVVNGGRAVAAGLTPGSNRAGAVVGAALGGLVGGLPGGLIGSAIGSQQ